MMFTFIKLAHKKSKRFGMRVSDFISIFVGTWMFVFLYTGSMLVWIYLHQAGILSIDSPNYIKWNLWLSYFAGTQASLVLMSSTRKSNQDRESASEALEFDIKTLEVAKKNQQKIHQMSKNILMLEEVIDEFLKEQKDE